MSVPPPEVPGRVGFNPRPREGSDQFHLQVCQQPLGFNPRPREGSDSRLSFAQDSPYIVSIRAPAKGAISYRRTNKQYIRVSIRAPAKGAISDPISRDSVISSFNPRPREGSDMRKCVDAAKRVRVSIRAPAKGAIRASVARQRVLQVSIRAPAKGAIGYLTLYLMECIGFNPRPREGSDMDLLPSGASAKCFNPRPREGSDGLHSGQGSSSACFNPRPREGSDMTITKREPAS